MVQGLLDSSAREGKLCAASTGMGRGEFLFWQQAGPPAGRRPRSGCCQRVEHKHLIASISASPLSTMPSNTGCSLVGELLEAAAGCPLWWSGWRAPPASRGTAARCASCSSSSCWSARERVDKVNAPKREGHQHKAGQGVQPLCVKQFLRDRHQRRGMQCGQHEDRDEAQRTDPAEERDPRSLCQRDIKNCRMMTARNMNL